jgi:hypothetical protein
MHMEICTVVDESLIIVRDLAVLVLERSTRTGRNSVILVK